MDLNKTGAAILVDQINLDNAGISIPASAFTFNAPAANDGPDSATHDTKITMSSVPGSGYTNSVNVTYDRLHINTDIVATGSAVFDKGAATRVADIVAMLNTRFGINLIEDVDFADADLPTFDGEEPGEVKTFSLAMLPGSSLIYKGSVTISVDAGDLDIQDLVTNTSLSGPTFL